MSTRWPRPRIVVSACLGIDTVRYDGSVIPNSLVGELRRYADVVAVCPEVAIGLGVPRPPVRLVQDGSRVRMIQPGTGRDVTDLMLSFAESFGGQLPPVDGFILKSRSPSCGTRGVRVYGANGSGPPAGKGGGLFATSMSALFTGTPMEDDGRLTNREIRSNFLARVFASARLREVHSLRDLVEFHTTYKFLLLAHHPRRAKALGRFVASAGGTPFDAAIAAYRAVFLEAMANPPTTGRFANAVEHLFGFVSEHLSREERNHFLAVLASYRRGALPSDAIITLLRSWAVRFHDEYLAIQTFFEPFPEELKSLESSGKSW